MTWLPLDRRNGLILGAIVTFGLCLRIGATIALGEQPLPDAITYRTAAADLLSGRYILSHLVMPLYPAAIALLGGARSSQSIVDVAASLTSIVLIWGLARTIFHDVLAAHVSALMFAVYPTAIFYAATGLSESFFVVLVLGAFLALYRNAMVIASLMFVLSILTRPALDLLVPVVLLWTIIVVHRQGAGRALRALGIYALAYGVLMAPWWMHNAGKYDQFVRLNLGMGVTLYTGNNPLNTTGGGIGGADVDLGAVTQTSDPIARDAAYKEAAIAFMKAEPMRVAELAVLKFQRFWNVLPYAPEYRDNRAAMLAALALLPVLLLALATLGLQWRRFWYFTPILGLFAYLTLVHMLTIGSIRYRFPLEPFLMVLAGPALVMIIDRLPGLRRLGPLLRQPHEARA